MTYDIQKELYWLFAIEYATLNSQAAFNAEKDSNGYAQGGLGAGVTNMSDWGGFNGSYPCRAAIPTNSETARARSHTPSSMRTDRPDARSWFRAIEVSRILSAIFGNGRTVSTSVSARPRITAATD